MSAKNFRLLLPALALACMATFAFADEGQAAQHVADGMPVVADHVDHMGVLPGTLVARGPIIGLTVPVPARALSFSG